MHQQEYSEINEHEVLAALEASGIQYSQGQRYLTSQCPMHEDSIPSAQIFKDDWFVNCMAGCGRFHITKVYPHLRSHESHSKAAFYQRRPAYQLNEKDGSQPMQNAKYKQFNLREQWEKLPRIPENITLKGIPADYLNEIGWRMENGSLGMGSGILIPYFDSTLQNIPFAQVRHPRGEAIRFHFLKDAEPKMYGVWNLEPGKPIFLVEGCSDWLVMDYSSIPAVAAPSSSQGALVKKMAAYCQSQGIEIIYGGDNDDAGDKLRQALDEAGVSYRVCQPPKEYNDWSDFFVAQGDLASGVEALIKRCAPYLYDQQTMPDSIQLNVDIKMTEGEKNELTEVLSLFGPGQYDVLHKD